MQKNIFASMVPKEHHNTFLNKEIGMHAGVFEHQVHQIFRKFSPNYQVAFLNYFRLSNNGFYMAPKNEVQSTKFLISDNDFEGYLSADAAGIVACLFAINKLHRKYPKNKKMILTYYALEDFAYEHPEAAVIFEAID